MTQNVPEIPSAPHNEETPQARVVHAAVEMAQAFEEAGSGNRLTLVKAVTDELKKSGMTLGNLHEAPIAFGDFNPDSLPGKRGAVSGYTRQEIFGRIAIKKHLGPYHRR